MNLLEFHCILFSRRNINVGLGRWVFQAAQPSSEHERNAEPFKENDVAWRGFVRYGRVGTNGRSRNKMMVNENLWPASLIRSLPFPLRVTIWSCPRLTFYPSLADLGIMFWILNYDLFMVFVTVLSVKDPSLVNLNKTGQILCWMKAMLSTIVIVDWTRLMSINLRIKQISKWEKKIAEIL